MITQEQRKAGLISEAINRGTYASGGVFTEFDGKLLFWFEDSIGSSHLIIEKEGVMAS
jgi:hypothetical protein